MVDRGLVALDLPCWREAILSVWRQSGVVAPEDNNRVLTAEPERIAHRGLNSYMAALVWHIIQIARRIRIFQVNRGVYGLVLHL